MKIIVNKKYLTKLIENGKDKVSYALSGNSGYIALDVSALEKIDTAGLQVFISLINSFQKTGRKYEVRGKSEVLELILECYGINL